MSRNKTSGCSLFILAIIFIPMIMYHYSDKFFFKEERDANEKQELINYWSQGTLNYFTDFDCNKINYIPKDVKIKKFFIIQSYLGTGCEINKRYFAEYDSIAILQPYITRKINEANCIVWINTIGENVHGQYSDGSDAIRLVAEINFIDIENKIIFKKNIVKFEGDPNNVITRRDKDAPHNVYFGKKPRKEIANTIRNAIEVL